MKKFKFEYEEHIRGSIVVEAETEEEALELCYDGEGDVHVFKSDSYIGNLLE